MENVRRVSKHFYCHICNKVFSALVNPDDLTYVRCPDCNQSFVEVTEMKTSSGISFMPEISKPIPKPDPPNLPQNPPHIDTHNIPDPHPDPLPDQHIPDPYHGYYYHAPRPEDPSFQANYTPSDFYQYTYQVPPAPPQPQPNMFFPSFGMFQNMGPAMNQAFSNFPEDEKQFEESKMPTIHFDFGPHYHSEMPFAQPMQMGFPAMDFRSLFSGLGFGNFFDNIGPFFSSAVDIDLDDFGANYASNFDRDSLFNLAQVISMQGHDHPGKPPASKAAVAKLPIFKLEEKHCKKGADGKLEQPGCAICCSNINMGENAQLLPCGHMYHPDCLKPWLAQNNTCPTCRYELPTDNASYEAERRQQEGPRRSARRPWMPRHHHDAEDARPRAYVPRPRVSRPHVPRPEPTTHTHTYNLRQAQPRHSPTYSPARPSPTHSRGSPYASSSRVSSRSGQSKYSVNSGKKI